MKLSTKQNEVLRSLAGEMTMIHRAEMDFGPRTVRALLDRGLIVRVCARVNGAPELVAELTDAGRAAIVRAA